MLPPALSATPEGARRFLRRALLLDRPAPDTGAALAHHGYVQIDPINVCGRMHDLILRNRVAGYREGDLLAHLYGEKTRVAFEHYLPGAGILVAYPLEAWPQVAEAIRRRRLRRSGYARRLGPKEEKVARYILDEIAARGPLMSDEIEHDGRSMTAWGIPGRLVKNLLEVLFVHGRVLIAARRNFRRVYDLPERVLPAEVLAQPPVAPRDAARWLVLNRLRQRRLVPLKRDELPLVADQVQPVRIEGVPLLHCLRSDAPLFDEPPPLESKPKLLAPLDPLIYDRRITRALWGFNYTWEVYTPAHKRVRGYYALPVLSGSEIVGHVDPKADRGRRKLTVVSRSVRRGHAVAASLDELAGFLGLRR